MVHKATKKELIFLFFDNKRNYERLHSMSRRIFTDDVLAEDALHDVYVTLHKAAESTTFLDDRRKAMPYIRKMLYHNWLKQDRRVKRLPAIVNEEAGYNEPVNDNRSIVEKLEKLNLLVQADASEFSEEQLKMWECMYKCCTPQEMVILLGKKPQTVYSLRNKMINKLRKRYKLDDICG